MGVIDPNSSTPNTGTTPTDDCGVGSHATSASSSSGTSIDSITSSEAGSISSVPIGILDLCAVRIAIKSIENTIRNSTRADFGELSKKVLEGFIDSLKSLINSYLSKIKNAETINASRETIINETNPAIKTANRTKLDEEQARRVSKNITITAANAQITATNKVNILLNASNTLTNTNNATANQVDPPPNPLLPTDLRTDYPTNTATEPLITLLNLTALYAQIEDADPATANIEIAAFLQDANLATLNIPTDITLAAFKALIQEYQIVPDEVDQAALLAEFSELINNSVNETIDKLEDIEKAAQESLEKAESGVKSLKERMSSKTPNVTINSVGISQSIHKNQSSVDFSFIKTLTSAMMVSILSDLDQSESIEFVSNLNLAASVGTNNKKGKGFSLPELAIKPFHENPIFISLAKTFEKPEILKELEALGITLSPAIVLALNFKTFSDFAALLQGGLLSALARLNFLQPPEGNQPSNEAVALNNATQLLIEILEPGNSSKLDKFIEKFIAEHPEFANLSPEQSASLTTLISSIVQENLISSAAGAFASALGEPLLQPTLTQLLLAKILGISSDKFDQELLGEIEKLKESIGKAVEQLLKNPQNSEDLQFFLLKLIDETLFGKEAVIKEEVQKGIIKTDVEKDAARQSNLRKQIVQNDAINKNNLNADLLKFSSTKRRVILKVLAEFKASFIFKTTEGEGLPRPELAFIENNEVFKSLLLKENINKLERLKEIRGKIRPTALKGKDHGSTLEILKRFIGDFNAAANSLKKAIKGILGPNIVASLLEFNKIVNQESTSPIFTKQLDSLFNDISKENGLDTKNLTPFERIIAIFSHTEEKEKEITTIFEKVEFESKKADLSALPAKISLASKEQNTSDGPMNLKTDATGRNTSEELAVDIPILG